MAYTKIVTESGNHNAETSNTQEVIRRISNSEGFVRFEGYGNVDDRWINTDKVTMVTEKP